MVDIRCLEVASDLYSYKSDQVNVVKFDVNTIGCQGIETSGYHSGAVLIKPFDDNRPSLEYLPAFRTRKIVYKMNVNIIQSPRTWGSSIQNHFGVALMRNATNPKYVFYFCLYGTGGGTMSYGELRAGICNDSHIDNLAGIQSTIYAAQNFGQVLWPTTTTHVRNVQLEVILDVYKNESNQYRALVSFYCNFDNGAYVFEPLAWRDTGTTYNTWPIDTLDWLNNAKCFYYNYSNNNDAGWMRIDYKGGSF